MRYMDSNEIRQMWLDFFASKGHMVQESVSLIPNNDPSLLWINAGVAALKKFFDGSEVPANKRITNSQKCIRTNDIENVGLTARHHTLFEMLGNFSIGDYFKNEAIEWGFELLTSEKWFAIPKDKLYMTVYPDDHEARDKWISVGVDPSHIVPCKDNFWEIGPGPCGPDSEIFFDRGPEYGDFTPQAIADDIENDRYIEIWNIVFSQFNAKEGMAREDYPELPNKNIDTGAGLERFCCIMQGAKTNFETDLFMPIINEVERLSGVKYEGQMAFKVIADHVRSVSFAISDGAMLSNEGRGYVLRRILRRAVKHAKSLGINEPFMYNLVDIVVDKMGGFYTNLVSTKDIIKKVIYNEEVKFFETLSSGLKMIESMNLTHIDGETAFTLYDTYGFPIELTVEYANENGLTVDMDGFKACLEAQKERARSARNNDASFGSQNEEFLDFHDESKFVGYDTLTTTTKCIKRFDEGLVFAETPFYAESGGQVADKGYIMANGSKYQVLDCQKMPNGQFLHTVEDNDIKEGDTVELVVDEEARRVTRCNHSSIHVMFSEMRRQIGTHVSQSGSYVSDKVLRFDFTNFENLTDEQILSIEANVKKLVKENHPVVVKEMTVAEAKEMGAIAEFGEKYGDTVRCVIMDNVTSDLCGGTHVSNLNEIDNFMICSVESKGSGIFRATGLSNASLSEIDNFMANYNKDIEAVREKGLNLVKEAHEKGIEVSFDHEINHNYIGSYQDFINKRQELVNLQDEVKELDKQIKKELEKKALSDLSSFDKFIEGDKLIARVENYEVNTLKQVVDALLDKLGTGVVFVANVVNNEKIIFVSKCNNGANCGILVKEAAMITGGNGGGKKEMAQAGGKDVSKLDEALNKVREILA